jgi:hypothetical protein
VGRASLPDFVGGAMEIRWRCQVFFQLSYFAQRGQISTAGFFYFSGREKFIDPKNLVSLR